MTDLRQAAQQALEALREFGYHGSSPRWERVANALTAALKEQDLEPVAWIFTPNTDLLWPAEVEAKNPIELNSYQPLYTTPPAPKREWQGLTDEEFLEACQIAERKNYLVAFQRIQIKLKEKNK